MDVIVGAIIVRRLALISKLSYRLFDQKNIEKATRISLVAFCFWWVLENFALQLMFVASLDLVKDC